MGLMQHLRAGGHHNFREYKQAQIAREYNQFDEYNIFSSQDQPRSRFLAGGVADSDDDSIDEYYSDAHSYLGEPQSPTGLYSRPLTLVTFPSSTAQLTDGLKEAFDYAFQCRVRDA